MPASAVHDYLAACAYVARHLEPLVRQEPPARHVESGAEDDIW